MAMTGRGSGFVDLAGTRVERAVSFAEHCHRGQVRKFTGEPYVTHPRSVARMVADRGLGELAEVVALLHDVIDDTSATPAEVSLLFGREVMEAVVWLSHDPCVPKGLKRAERLACDNLRLARAPIWVKNIKLCDVFDNVSRLALRSPVFAESYFREKEDQLRDALSDAEPALLSLVRSIISPGSVSDAASTSELREGCGVWEGPPRG